MTARHLPGRRRQLLPALSAVRRAHPGVRVSAVDYDRPARGTAVAAGPGPAQAEEPVW
ncbi:MULTISPECIES: hypothetical protein [Streptomyces]|uniref:hypothetical protein n=1 Tax=Streptomyces TaxID=1883 RepID=UPI0016771EE5|nr:hypothetical protein [Streptomyces canarius]